MRGILRARVDVFVNVEARGKLNVRVHVSISRYDAAHIVNCSTVSNSGGL